MNPFRIVFWLAVVVFMMPHEPNLGLGRPGTLFAAKPAPDDGAVEGPWGAVSERLSQLRSEFAEQER